MSLYNKYRAERFNQILGQDHVVSILRSSLISGSCSHAYLFFGTRGSGKTSVSRILARALNCTNFSHIQEFGEPCNVCESCSLALQSSHPDIIEMDAASNRGIDEIRSLKESVKFLPSIGRKKVYIIDEVHMMTREAFNALLKTLEEPPEHVAFILCTTELSKVPPTILSRSQVFEFKPATEQFLEQKINLILKNEGKALDTESIRFIVRLAKGSFRDAETILEKVLASDVLRNSSVANYSEVVDILGYANIQGVLLFKEALYNCMLDRVVHFIENNLSEGLVTSFNYQLCEEIYGDIVDDFSKGKLDKKKVELFNFLVSLEKDLRSASNQRMVYLAKILNFLLKKGSSQINRLITNNDSLVREYAGGNVQPNLVEHNYSDKDKLSHGQSASSIDHGGTTVNNNALKPSIEEKDLHGDFGDRDNYKGKLKSDFLAYLLDNNVFLHKFFNARDFEFEDDKSGSWIIRVKVNKQIDEKIIKAARFSQILSDFSRKTNLKLRLETHSDKSNVVNKSHVLGDSISKTVSELSDEEIKNMFD